MPKTGLEPVSLSAADFKSDVYTVPPLGPTAPKCGRASDWQPGKAGRIRLRLALGTKPDFLPRMDRLAQTFARCKAEGRPAFVSYVCAGDPDVETSKAVLLSLAQNGREVCLRISATADERLTASSERSPVTPSRET